MQDLFVKSKKLEEDANLLFGELGLEEYFKSHGNVELVGSVRYGLMSWEDLDIDLVTSGTPNDELFWKISKYLLSLDNTKLLMLADNRKGDREVDRPKSMYLGMKYEFKGSIWKVDIRLIKQSEVKPLPTWMQNLSSVSDSKKRAILKLKDNLKGDSRYHKQISSVDVYDAVVNKNITSFDAFIDLVESKG